MEALKRSIYLDADVDAALKASAAANGRSVTKQMNLMLRSALGMEQSFRNVTLTPAAPMSAVRPYSKDQQLGRKPKSKKLT